MNVFTNFTANLSGPLRTNVMRSIKGDTARTIRVRLTDGVEPYVIEKGSYGVLMGKKPDGTVLYNHCYIEDNAVLYDFTDQTASAIGSFPAAIRLFGPDKSVITTVPFQMEVYENAFDAESAAKSEDEQTALDDLTNRVLSLMLDIQAALDNGEFNGATFIPHIKDTDGGWEMSWTNDKDLPNPSPITIPGSKQLAAKQNWATVKLSAFPEAETADTLHAWVNANHKGPDRKWLVESSNPDWAKLVASLGGVPEGTSGDAFIMLEIPYSEAGPEMLRAQYVLRNNLGVWDMTQYATYSSSSPKWYSTGWYEVSSIRAAVHTTMNVEIEDDGFGGYRTVRYNDSDINNHRNAGGIVQAKYYSYADDQTYTYYYSTMESDRKPTFIRTYINADGKTVQVLASVGNDGTVEIKRRTADTVSSQELAEAIQSVEEQIPNVPDWAMQPKKPTYTASEVGADTAGAADTAAASTLAAAKEYTDRKSVTSVIDETASTLALTPNVWHRWGEVASLTLTLAPEVPGIVNDYLLEFTSGGTPTTVVWPAGVVWAEPPAIEANRRYQASIVNGLGVIADVGA